MVKQRIKKLFSFVMHIQLNPAIGHFKRLVKIIVYTEIFIIVNIQITENASWDQNLYALLVG